MVIRYLKRCAGRGRPQNQATAPRQGTESCVESKAPLTDALGGGVVGAGNRITWLQKHQQGPPEESVVGAANGITSWGKLQNH